jgi:hypothetical protein
LKEITTKPYDQPMDIHLSSLSLEELINLYQKANLELEKSLLEGKQWEAIKVKKQMVTELSIVIHKRIKGEETATV